MKKFSINFSALSGFALFFSAVLTLSSCSEEVMNLENQETVPVHIRVNEFSVSLADIPDAQTRAVQDVADYDGVGAIDLAFYSGATEVFKATQVRGDGSYTTFGEFSCNLPVGNYTMVVVGRGYFADDVFTLTSPTVAGYTSDHVRETFVATQAVNITGTDPVNLSATLERIVAKVLVVSTDGKLAEAKKVRTTFSASGKGLNPSTGLATTNTGFSNTVGVSTAAGTTSTSINFAFLYSDEQTMNVTVDVLNEAGDAICTHTIHNVPLKRNRITKLSGPIYTAMSLTTSAFQLETDWLSEHTVNF
jgi:hypothetical protein